MALEYVVTKRVFGFDDSKTEKYVAKSVRSGEMSFSKTCAKVSRLCGVHRKIVDLVVSGLVDIMAEDIDDGKSVQLGEFGIFRPTIKAKSEDSADKVTASNIIRKRIVFTPGKIFQRTLGEMSVTRSVPVDTDYTDGSSSGNGGNSGNQGGGSQGGGGVDENPLG
ncbi:HU family DNA-binding protein [Bacteroides stercorirosoris]|uniref:DNA-binding protein n=1 Tax=Bacteroides stercorirosoris TaxID=871324 RepID=A0A1M6FHB6_9BACE|nr:HU family DNA-binding protein [Bacteroides stercorirosoris]OKZ06087.1 MAG: DNA-binding protein [Bacteroides oleiciplenus]RGX80045.1 DNA-binding protein [Bacteroides stercorirosoris]SHI97124.1 DNA-binding protein, histone-like, putative [Bacteroides stercorirosoris]